MVESPCMEGNIRIKSEIYGWASRTNKYIVGQFRNPVNPKDGFAVGDCEDFWAKQILKFLIPILYPEKPICVTVTMDNTIFEALLRDKPMDWRLLLFNVVGRMVGLVSKGKTNHGLLIYVPSLQGTSIPPLLRARHVHAHNGDGEVRLYSGSGTHSNRLPVRIGTTSAYSNPGEEEKAEDFSKRASQFHLNSGDSERGSWAKHI